MQTNREEKERSVPHRLVDDDHARWMTTMPGG